LRQAACQLAAQSEGHQLAQQFLRVRRALAQVVPAQAAEFGLHPAPQVLHLAAHLIERLVLLSAGGWADRIGRAAPVRDALINCFF
jgi:hypothetical protein